MMIDLEAQPGILSNCTNTDLEFQRPAPAGIWPQVWVLVWVFDQPRQGGSSRAQFGFVQLLSVIGVLGEMPTLRPWPR